MTLDLKPADPEHSFEFPLNESVKKELVNCPLSFKVIRHILKLAGGEKGDRVISWISNLSGYSNDVVRLNLENAQSLMVKRARYDWLGPRFESSRRASKLIRQESTLLAPEHLPISEGTDQTPLLAYWYLPLPTLKSLWPDLSVNQKKNVLRSLGQMLRKMHKIGVNRYGLLNDWEHIHTSLSSFMRSDLLERLKPAVWAHWSDALPLIDRLAEMADSFSHKEPVLVHNDLHLDNILCKVEKEEVHCVGVLDLEAAGGGRVESDIASAIVLHDPFFSREDEEIVWLKDFDRYLTEGYGKEPDPDLIRFFKVYHLLNIGFFFAHRGEEERADRIVKAVKRLL